MSLCFFVSSFHVRLKVCRNWASSENHNFCLVCTAVFLLDVYSSWWRCSTFENNGAKVHHIVVEIIPYALAKVPWLSDHPWRDVSRALIGQAETCKVGRLIFAFTSLPLPLLCSFFSCIYCIMMERCDAGIPMLIYALDHFYPFKGVRALQFLEKKW